MLEVPLNIAYLASRYPDVSHTFILREVHALRARGLRLSTFSVRRAQAHHILGESASDEAVTTRWLIPMGLRHWGLALLHALGCRPLRFLRTFGLATCQRKLGFVERFKWFCYFLEAIALSHWLVTESFDHLHCHFGNSGSSTGMLAARLAGITFSMTCHGSEIRETRKHRLAEKVKQAAFVACVSNYGKAQLMRACDPDYWTKLRIVRCGVLPRKARSARKNGGSACILCVARLAPEKAHLVLLDALAHLRDRAIEFHCTFVGDGPMRAKIEARASELQLTSCLTLVGSLVPDRVDEMYRLSDVVVLASFSEGVPVVLMEAMAHKVPVAATNVGGVAELVEDGVNGLLVPPGNAISLATALERIVRAPDRGGRMGSAGLDRLRERFDPAVAADTLLQLFTDAVRAGPSAQTE